jgi:hypothetical protein
MGSGSARYREISSRARVTVVIRCLNEAEGIASVVAEARAGLNPRRRARRRQRLVRRGPRRGYGSAYLTGLAAALMTKPTLADDADLVGR